MSSPLSLVLACSLCCSVAPFSVQAATAKKSTAPKTVPRAAPPAPLDPALETHAAQYDANLAALKAARVAELAQRRAAYLGELDAALAKVAGGADAAMIGMLKKEREGIAGGLVAPANPVGLPPEIQTARKLFFNRVEFAAMTFAAEKKKLDDAYLKLLVTLGRQTKGDKTMPARIAAERRRVQAGQ